MQCADCNTEILRTAKFCPFCGSPQTPKMEQFAETEDSNLNMWSDHYEPDPPIKGSAPLSSSSAPVQQHKESVLLRASDKIWYFNEPEGKIIPGERRPLIVMDEETVHLAHTDRILDGNLLLNRIRSLIQSYGVPVDAQLVNAKWASDEKELRPRIIANLRNHSYSDIKMILGVDYLGKWASIQMNLCREPEPLPHAPQEPVENVNIPPIILIALGGLFILLGLAEPRSMYALIFIGFLMIAAGFFWKISSGSRARDEYVMNKIKWEAEQRQRELEKAIDRLSRTYKVDDMKLFCSAMSVIFKAVVDDIVQRGGEVVRIEGGQGGYFRQDITGKPQPTKRQANAALSEV